MDNKIKISYPSSEKVYIPGNIHKDIKVAMRRVKLTPTVSIVNGEKKLRKTVRFMYMIPADRSATRTQK